MNRNKISCQYHSPSLYSFLDSQNSLIFPSKPPNKIYGKIIAREKDERKSMRNHGQIVVM